MQSKNISGTIIGDRYKLVEILGKGGVGITYSAIDLHTQAKVAIKAVSLRQLDDWKQVELLEREAQVLAQLNHPAIPKYLDYFQVDTEQDRLFYIVQQLAPGKSLYQLVESGWRTTEIEVKEIAQQILEILIYLHSLKPPVIHRDIKPHNLIIDPVGWLELKKPNVNNSPVAGKIKVYLVDFGAVQNTYYDTLMRGSTVVGTFGYMSPEQFQGKATPASDLYSLGATILYLLTHRSPAELPHDTLKIDFRNAVNIVPGFANWLEKILQPDLEERFTSAQEALKKLSDRSLLTNKNKGNSTLLNLMVISTITLGVIIGFNAYKWGILSRLGYQPTNLGNNYDVLKNYLDTGGNPDFFLHTPGYDGQTLLFGVNSLELAKLLIEQGVDVNAQDKNGRTALMTTYDFETAKLLIEQGVDVNAQDKNGRTALMETNDLEIAKLLIEKSADVNAKDNEGNTPLLVFLRNNSREQSELVKLLITKGTDVNAKNNYGNTPLMQANNLDVAELLIAEGADVNAKDKEGNTALFYAMKNQLYEVAAILINRGADINIKYYSSNDFKKIKVLLKK